MADDLKNENDQISQYDNENLLEKQSQKSQSQCSVTGSHSNEPRAESSHTKSPAVDALLAKHPGIDFTAE